MSSDNGIYILESNDGFRVAHLQAIENLYYWEISCCSLPKLIKSDYNDIQYRCVNCDNIFPQYERREEINPIVLMGYFGDSQKYTNEHDALEAAIAIAESVEENYGYSEYGICKIKYNGDFPR